MNTINAEKTLTGYQNKDCALGKKGVIRISMDLLAFALFAFAIFNLFYGESAALSHVASITACVAEAAFRYAKKKDAFTINPDIETQACIN